MTDREKAWEARRWKESQAAYQALMKCYPLNPEPLTGEIFKAVEGFDDYQISNYGRETILKPAASKGYLFLTLSKKGVHKNARIHRLVAQAFIPNPDNKPEVNHIDGHSLNNFFENLEWCTESENTRHAIKMGLRHPPEGINHHSAKLTTEQIKYIREVYTPHDKEFGCNALAEKFNVSASTISLVINNKSYRNID